LIQKAPYKYMAHLLQKAEVEFMIDTMIPILLDLPKFSFFTIHDSVVVPKSRYEMVKLHLNVNLRNKNIPTTAN
jgi:hypothetical protein